MQVAGLEITVDRTAYRAYGIMGLIPVVVLGGYAALFRRRDVHGRTLIALPVVGVGVAGYHALAQLVHQLGHALAARATGYPMTGMRYEHGFTYSTYPPDEPRLPATVHLLRSFGGVGGATLMLVIGVVLWLRGRMTAHWVRRGLVTFVLLDSLLLFLASAVVSDGLLFVVQRGWTARHGDTETMR